MLVVANFFTQSVSVVFDSVAVTMLIAYSFEDLICEFVMLEGDASDFLLNTRRELGV